MPLDQYAVLQIALKIGFASSFSCWVAGWRAGPARYCRRRWLRRPLPNGAIQNNNLINYTRLGQLRVDFVFNVSYADDLNRVKQALYEILIADERVLAEPAPLVFVQTLDENGA